MRHSIFYTFRFSWRKSGIVTSWLLIGHRFWKWWRHLAGLSNRILQRKRGSGLTRRVSGGRTNWEMLAFPAQSQTFTILTGLSQLIFPSLLIIQNHSCCTLSAWGNTSFFSLTEISQYIFLILHYFISQYFASSLAWPYNFACKTNIPKLSNL